MNANSCGIDECFDVIDRSRRSEQIQLRGFHLFKFRLLIVRSYHGAAISVNRYWPHLYINYNFVRQLVFFLPTSG